VKKVVNFWSMVPNCSDPRGCRRASGSNF